MTGSYWDMKFRWAAQASLFSYVHIFLRLLIDELYNELLVYYRNTMSRIGAY